MARGRKKKQNMERTRTGRISRAKAARRHHAERDKKEAREVAYLRQVRDALYNRLDNPLHGSKLGLLCLEGFLSESQFRAGLRWEGLVRQYAGLMGMNLVPRITALMDFLPKGESLSDEPDEDMVQSVRQSYDEAFEALHRAHKQELRRVALNEQPPEDRYVLREALDILVKLWKLEDKESTVLGSKRTKVYRALIWLCTLLAMTLALPSGGHAWEAGHRVDSKPALVERVMGQIEPAVLAVLVRDGKNASSLVDSVAKIELIADAQKEDRKHAGLASNFHLTLGNGWFAKGAYNDCPVSLVGENSEKITRDIVFFRSLFEAKCTKFFVCFRVSSVGVLWSNRQYFSRKSTYVINFYFKGNFKPSFMFTDTPADRRLNGNPRALLSELGSLGDFVSFRSFIDRFPRSDQSFSDEINAKRSDAHGKAGGDKHQKAPQGHILLGLQILVGGLLVVVGFYSVGYAMSDSRRLHPDAGACYFLGGVTAILVGGLLITGINLMYFGVLF